MGKTDADINADEGSIRPERSEVYELICDNRKAKNFVDGSL